MGGKLAKTILDYRGSNQWPADSNRYMYFHQTMSRNVLPVRCISGRCCLISESSYISVWPAFSDTWRNKATGPFIVNIAHQRLLLCELSRLFGMFGRNPTSLRQAEPTDREFTLFCFLEINGVYFFPIMMGVSVWVSESFRCKNNSQRSFAIKALKLITLPRGKTSLLC